MKYNLKIVLISISGLILLFCTLSYLIAPQSNVFTLSSINPLSFFEGVAFIFGFGLGFPMWLSVIVIVTFVVFLFLLFMWIAQKVVK